MILCSVAWAELSRLSVTPDLMSLYDVTKLIRDSQFNLGGGGGGSGRRTVQFSFYWPIVSNNKFFLFSHAGISPLYQHFDMQPFFSA